MRIQRLRCTSFGVGVAAAAREYSRVRHIGYPEDTRGRMRGSSARDRRVATNDDVDRHYTVVCTRDSGTWREVLYVGFLYAPDGYRRVSNCGLFFYWRATSVFRI